MLSFQHEVTTAPENAIMFMIKGTLVRYLMLSICLFFSAFVHFLCETRIQTWGFLHSHTHLRFSLCRSLLVNSLSLRVLVRTVREQSRCKL